jgi:hypothetical protein
MRIRPLLAAALVVSGAAIACHGKVDEPNPTTANPPASGSAPIPSASTVSSFPGSPSSSGMTPTVYAPAGSASNGPDPKAPFGPRELKEFNMHITNEECEKAAIKKNTLEGLPEHDKKGSLLIWACLRRGNVAWYRCVLTADNIEHFNWCSQRYLVLPDEITVKQ